MPGGIDRDIADLKQRVTALERAVHRDVTIPVKDTKEALEVLSGRLDTVEEAAAVAVLPDEKPKP